MALWIPTQDLSRTSVLNAGNLGWVTAGAIMDFESYIKNAKFEVRTKSEETLLMNMN